MSSKRLIHWAIIPVTDLDDQIVFQHRLAETFALRHGYSKEERAAMTRKIIDKAPGACEVQWYA